MHRNFLQGLYSVYDIGGLYAKHNREYNVFLHEPFLVLSLKRVVLEENRSIKTDSETFLCHFTCNVNYLAWPDPPASTICITSSDMSPINQYSDIKLYTDAGQPSFFQESLVSRVAQILIIDILYACYALKHYKRSIKMVEDSAAALVKVLHFKNNSKL